MKKFLSTVIIFLFVASGYANATIVKGNYDKAPSKYFRGITIDTNKREIIRILKSMTKHANKKNIEAIKSVYAKEYLSSDGFDFDTYMKMTEETFKSYPNIKYKTRIDDIVVTGDYAVARMSDYTQAKLDSILGENDKKGKLEGICKYTTHLKKGFDGWKIIYDDVVFEESAIKYGDAKKINISLDAPPYVEPGKDYEIALTVDYPNEMFAMASVGNEKIVYPDAVPKESFRKIKDGMPLERIVRSNKTGHNEYAVASVGLTKVATTENKESNIVSFTFKLSGMAFVMRRINVFENKVLTEPSK